MKHLESTRASAARQILTAFLAVQTVALNFSPAWAAPAPDAIPYPTGGYTAGEFTQDGAKLTIESTRVNSPIDWDSFNIGSDAHVVFKDAAGNVTINRIGGGQSEIFGKLDANGIIYLLNKSGVLFGSGSRVNVGGLVASTFMDVADNPEGGLIFQGEYGDGTITVQPNATINAGAFAYLVGRNVDVAGTVNAGDTVFAAYGSSESSEFTLATSGGGTITINLGDSWTAGEDGTIEISDEFNTGSVEDAYEEGDISLGAVESQGVTLYASGAIIQGDGSSWKAGAPVAMEAAGGDITLGQEANVFAETVKATAANGAVTIKATDALTLDDVTAGGLLTVGAGSISQAENKTITANGADLTATSGDITLDNAANQFSDSVLAKADNGAITIKAANELKLGEVTGSGAVKLDGGSIKVEAPVESTGDILTILSQGTVESTAAGTLTAANDVQVGGEGTVIVNHNAETGEDSYAYIWQPSGATEVKLAGDVSAPAGAVWIGGDSIRLDGNVESGKTMWLNAENGNISQGTGSAVTAGDEAVLHATGGDILLGNDGNDFQGTVVASGKNVTLTDKNDILLGDVTAEDLAVTAAGGEITQADGTTVTAAGATELEAAGSISLFGGGNDFGGTVSATSGGDVYLNDANAMTVGNVEATNGITLYADTDLTVAGTVHGHSSTETLVTAKQGVLTVEEGASVRDDTGALALMGKDGIVLYGQAEGKSVTIDAGDGALTSGTNAHVTAREKYVHVSTKGDMDLPAIDAENLQGDVYGDGNITQSGAIHTTTSDKSVHLSTSNGSITLTNAENRFSGTTEFQAWGGGVDVHAAGDLGVTYARADSDVTLAADGGLSVKDVAAGGAATLAADGGNLAVGEYGVTADSLEMKASGGIDLGGNVAVTNGLTATAGGNISQAGDQALAVGGTTELTATAGNIVLTNAVNDFGGAVSATATNGSVSLTDANTILLGDVTATDLTVAALAGGITQSMGKVISAANTATLTARDTIDLEGSMDVGGDLAMTAAAIDQGIQPIVVGGNTVLTATNGSISMVSLNTNDFQGTVTATAVNGDIDLDDRDDITLGQLTASNGFVRVDVWRHMTVDGEVTAGKSVLLSASSNMTVNAAVKSSGTGEADGGTMVAAGGYLVTSADATIEAADFVFLEGDTNVELAAPVTAGTDVDIWANARDGEGTLTTLEAATITAQNGSVTMTNSANVLLGGDVKAEIPAENPREGAGQVVISATNGYLTVEGTADVSADSDAVLTASTDIMLDGNVTASDNLTVTAGGDFTQGTGSRISVTNAAALTAGNKIDLGGTMDVGGDLTAAAAEMQHGVNPLVVGGDATLTATNGSISMNALFSTDFQGTVTATAVNGDIDISDGGNITLGKLTASNGYVVVDVRTNMTVNGEVTAGKYVLLNASSNMTVNAAVKSSGIGEADGGTLVTAGGYLVTSADATIEAADFVFLEGDTYVELGAPVTAGTDVDIWANARDGEGTLTTLEAATITARNGHVIMTNSANVVLGGDVRAEIPDENPREGAGQMVIAATNGNMLVQSTAEVSAGADALLTASGDMEIAGAVSAGQSVEVEAGGGFSNTGAGTLTADAGDLTIAATDAVALDAAVEATAGSVDIRGLAVAGTTNGTVTAGDALTVAASGGDISLEGRVLAKDADFAADGAVTAVNEDNDFTGTVTAKSENGSVKLADANALALGEVSAKEDIEATAGTTLEAVGIVSAGRDLTLESGDDMTVTNAVSAGGDVTLTSTGGALKVTSSGSVTAGTNAVLTAATDMELAGAVTGGGEAKAKAGGEFTSTETGDLTAKNGLAQIDAGTGATVGGDVKSLVDNPETASEFAGFVDVALQNGALTVQDTSEVYAADTATFTATGGDITVAGSVAAGHDVNATTDQNFENTAEIAALDGDVTIEAGQAVTISNAVTATNGKIDITAGNGATVAARMETSRAADAPEESPAGLVIVMATGGDVKVTTAGSIEAATDVELAAEDGSIEIEGNVTAANDVKAAASQDFTVASNATVTAQGGDAMVGAGSIDIAGTLQAETQNVGAGATNGNLNVTGQVLAGASIEMGAAVDATISGTVEGVEMVGVDALGKATVKDGGKVSSTGPDGTAVVVGDEAEVEKNGTVIAAAGQAGVVAVNGPATIAGTVTSATNTQILASGNVVVSDTGEVVATGEDATVLVMSQEGDVEIAGKVQATDGLVVGTASDGSLKVTDTGKVLAGTDAELTAENGEIEIAGVVAATSNVTATASQAFTLANTGTVTAQASNVVVKAGSMDVAGTIQAVAGSVQGTATNGAITVAADKGKVLAGTDVELTSEKGDIEIAGIVDADNDLTAQATNDVTAASGATVHGGHNAFLTGGQNATVETRIDADTGSVLVSATNGTAKIDAPLTAGKHVTVDGGSGVELNANLEAGTDVAVRSSSTNGTVRLKEGIKVNAGEDLVMKAGQDLSLTTATIRGKNVGLEAETGNLTDANATLHADNAMVLKGNGMVTLKGGIESSSLGMVSAGDITADHVTAQRFAATSTGGSVTVNAESSLDLANLAAIGQGAVTAERANGGTEKVDGTTAAGGLNGIQAARNATLTAKGLTVSGSQIVAGDTANIDVGTYTVDRTTAGNNLELKAGSVENGSSTLHAGNTLHAEVSGGMTAGSMDANTIIANVHGNFTAGSMAANTIDATVGGNLSAGTVTGNSSILATVGGLATVGTMAGGTIDLTVNGPANVTTMTGSDMDLDFGADADIGTMEAKGSVDMSVTGSALMGTATVGSDFTANVGGALTAGTLAAGHDIVLSSVGGDFTGTTVTAGNVIDATVGGSVDYDTVSAGSSILADINGSLTANTVSSGGTFDAAIGGGLTANTLTTGGAFDATVGNDISVDTMSIGGPLTATAGGDFTTGTLTTGGDLTATAGGDFASGTLTTGGNLDVTAGGAFTAQTMETGGSATIHSGSETTVDSMRTGGSLDLTSGGGASLTEAEIGGDARIDAGGALTFDTMRADNVQVDAGSINMGKLDAGNADLHASGSIRDNGSMVTVRNTLTMTAGGDIGSAGSPINTETGSRIERISGDNIYLVEHASGHNIVLGVIDANGHLSLSAPRIGLPDGKYGFVDGNGDELNLIAGSGLELNLGGRMGTASDPLEAKVSGKWTILNGELSGTPMSYIYIVMSDTAYTDTPEYIGMVAIPGLVIVNGRPVLGHPDLLRKIYSALAFSVDTPELKSTQGIFGQPLFLHSDMALFNPGETGVDYWNVVPNERLNPNLMANQDEYRHWGITGDLWNPIRMSRSEMYLWRAQPPAKADRKPSAPEGERKAK